MRAIEINVRMRLQLSRCGQAKLLSAIPAAMSSSEIRKPRCAADRAAATALSAFCNWKRPGRLGATSMRPARGNFSDRARTRPSSSIRGRFDTLRRCRSPGSEFGRPCKDHLARFRPLFRHDDRHAGLENSGFLAGDFPQRMPQKILVIEIDARNKRNHRRDNVRGIQAAAEAHLKNRETRPVAWRNIRKPSRSRTRSRSDARAISRQPATLP